MTDELKRAAQALVDHIRDFPTAAPGMGFRPHEQWWTRNDLAEALRAALASPTPSPSTADQECDHRMCSCPDGCECKRATCPAPSPSRDAARDDALEEAARTVDTYAHEAQDWFRETSESRWTTRLAARIRSLKGQPPPADKEK